MEPAAVGAIEYFIHHFRAWFERVSVGDSDAILRHRLNKRRHREWQKRFVSLREAERRLEDLLGSQQPPESQRQSKAETEGS